RRTSATCSSIFAASRESNARPVSMPKYRIRALTVVWMLAAFACGIAFEHVVGIREAIEATGWRDWVVANQLQSTAGREPVPVATATRGRTMVALVFGQSNAGNSGETPGKPQRGVFQYYRGEIFEARDPLLGASGDGGSIWLRLAAKLVAR